MSEINDIKSQIKALVQTIDKVQEVETYDKMPANGFPLVTITISENENEFYSTANNMRTYVFLIRIYDQIAQNPDTSSWNSAVERAEQNLGVVVNEILDVLDKNYTLSNTVDYVETAPSAWGYLETELGWSRTAEISLRVKKQFNFTT